MTIELKFLGLSVILGIFQVLLAGGFATAQRGVKWNLSSRGKEMPPLTGAAGRIDRASQNFKETFPFFLAAVVLVQFLGRQDSLTALGAQLYFFGRLIYLPVYALDITHVRTLIWGIATLGIALILFAAF